MIYFFDENAGSELLHIKGEMHKYLVKVRRHQEGDTLKVRSKKEIAILHSYKVITVEPRFLELELIESKRDEVKAKQDLHIAWCIIDAKSVEKVLASLNEIGVSKISFISCARSQKNFKIDLKRYERILEASMQQCGRTQMMEFYSYKNIKSFLEVFPDTKVFDFTEKTLDDCSNFKEVLIGCEGGFSESERELLESQEVFRLNTPIVLRSESAALSVAAKILL